ncbi:MAG: hypothetical protein AAFR26_21530, partial [Cyanobacteria bacterium J06626_4]
MQEQHKRWLIEGILEISNNVIRDKIPSTGTVVTIEVGDPFKGNVKFSLLEQEQKQLQILVRKSIKKFDCSDKFTESTLEHFISELLISAVVGKKREEILNELNDLLAYIANFKNEVSVYIPIEGLRLQFDNLKIGEITFKKISQTAFLKIAGVHNTAPDWLFAEFKAIAEPNRALERAQEEAELAMDILRYALASLRNSDKEYAIGIEGEVAKSISRYPVIESSSLPEEVYYLEVKRGISNIVIDLEKTLEDSGANKVVSILNSGSAISDFEKAILRAVHWFSLSEKQRSNENKLLALVTCLETFLTSEHGNPIRNTVAEGSALVLASTLENRKYIKHRINEFYKQRSSISHGGGSKNILDSD